MRLLFLILTLTQITLIYPMQNIKPSTIFSDNMVLQQNMKIPVWGKADPETIITVELKDQKVSCTADSNGDWKLFLQPLEAGGPYDLCIFSNDSLVYKNVMIGEVWLCSGQSNMEMPLAGWGCIDNYRQEIADANYPGIRLLTVDKSPAVTPLENINTTGWKVCSPETIEEFSSAAYFFGVLLQKKMNVPVGLINSSFAGTVAEAWTSIMGIKQFPEFASAVNTISTSSPQFHNYPTVLFNGMIAPIVPFAIKGVIWYQGESNTERAMQYRQLMPSLITDWRNQWGEGNFPFIITQLANFGRRNTVPIESTWAELREAQALTTKLDKTFLAVTIDIGEADDIHPKNKQEVGRRLGLIALEKVYKENVFSSGPVFKSMSKEGNKIRISFDNIAGGLKVKGNTSIKGFTIAGEDNKFYNTEARIDKNMVIISSPKVNNPTAVRYLWSDNPECNLYNSEDLPAAPFRTDNL